MNFGEIRILFYSTIGRNHVNAFMIMFEFAEILDPKLIIHVSDSNARPCISVSTGVHVDVLRISGKSLSCTPVLHVMHDRACWHSRF